MVNRKSQVVLLFAIYDLPFTQRDKLMNQTIEQQVIETIRVLHHRHEDFINALELYKSRLDKGYGLTDCFQ